MLARLIDFSLRQRALVLLAAAAMALAGAWAYLNLPIDAFPDISPTQVKVILKVPGMTPEEVEQRLLAHAALGEGQRADAAQAVALQLKPLPYALREDI